MRGKIKENQTAALLANVMDAHGVYPVVADVESITLTVTATADDTTTHTATLDAADVLHETLQHDANRWWHPDGFNLEVIAPGTAWPEPGNYVAEVVIVTTDAQVLPVRWELQATAMFSV